MSTARTLSLSSISARTVSGHGSPPSSATCSHSPRGPSWTCSSSAASRTASDGSAVSTVVR
ncbi:MAG TPA: hypothetical protein DEP45_02275 [Armatimonadetes bacterium]|nr:hypothetical protein [Armatimonadota bacterium]